LLVDLTNEGNHRLYRYFWQLDRYWLKRDKGIANFIQIKPKSSQARRWVDWDCVDEASLCTVGDQLPYSLEPRSITESAGSHLHE
jgi:hypothetical protein